MIHRTLTHAEIGLLQQGLAPLTQGTLPLDQALKITVEVASALDRRIAPASSIAI